MSAVYEAHLRMLSSLPVRTHAQRAPPTPERTASDHRPEIGMERRGRIRALLESGVKKRRLPDIIGISRSAIQKHLRAIKRGR